MEYGCSEMRKNRIGGRGAQLRAPYVDDGQLAAGFSTSAR